MALINIPVCIILGGKAYAALKDYERQEKEGKDPQFKAESIGLSNTECWK
jgi:AGCS family alanine or glycine:cation symporter